MHKKPGVHYSDDVIVEYDSGFPTRFQQQYRLSQLLSELGTPRIEGCHCVWSHPSGMGAVTWNYPSQFRNGRKVVCVRRSDHSSQSN